MGSVEVLRKHITYKNSRIFFQKQPNGSVYFLLTTTVPTRLFGVGDNINDAIGKARDMVDKMEKKDG